MSQLYVIEYKESKALCFSCADVFDKAGESKYISCPQCGFSIEEKRYREFYRHAFYALRYGFQYRRQIEQDQDKEDKVHFNLSPLGELATFIALAAASGVLGNAAWAGVKLAIKKIIKQNKSVENERTFSDSEIEQLIAYISDYEDGFKNLPEKVQNDITEEILGDAAAENPIIADKLAKLLFKNETPTESSKRQAMILYKELGRRSSKRSQKRPSTPGWRFWDNV